MALKLRSADLYDILQRGVIEGSNEPRPLTRDETHQAYNALDSAVTLRVHENLRPRVEASPHASVSYHFVRAMQGPAMAMMRTGIAINAKVRQDETQRYLSIRDKAQALLDRLADAVWGPEEYIEVVRTKETYIPTGKRGQPLSPRTRVARTEVRRVRVRGLNASSTKQCLAFFNIALGFPPEHEIRKTPHGTERTPTANDKALRKWAERRTKGPGIDPRDRTVLPVRLAQPFVSLILSVREADKMLSVLRTPLDADGRMRCSYNVVGTENGRWSSSKNAFGRGTNLQNVEPSMRRMFCADDGWRLVSTDLEQAESYVTGGEVWRTTGDDTYWRAILSGDLHTTVARMCWPELEWTDDPKANRSVADRPSRELPKYSYRDLSKRLGHGSNYRGSAFGIAQAVGIPPRLVEDFQSRYFHAFPAIPLWHGWVKDQLRQHQFLDTPLGRRRWFFGRPNEDATLREAIAFVPQSTVGELLNLIMWKCWARSLLPSTDSNHLPIQLLLQNHDAFAFQVPTHAHLPTIIASVNAEFQAAAIPLQRNEEHRTLTIPGEFVTGFNWGYADPKTFSDGNPDGLMKWRGSDERQRVQRAATSPGDWLSGPVARVF